MSTETNQFEYRLEGMFVANFGLIFPRTEIIEERLGLEYGYDFKFDFDTDTTNGLLHFKYAVMDPDNPTAKPKSILHCDINYIFKVLNLKNYVTEVEGKQKLDTGVLVTLLSIAYSTSRGIIHAKTTGNPINRFLLPIMTLDELVRQDAPISPTASSPPS